MDRLGPIAFIVWQLGSVVTFIKLTFFDDYIYTWWNWIIVVPINLFLGEIWPIYWLILRPIFGASGA
jgi:hypothetical protein